MREVPAEKGCCARCWANHHHCFRTSTSSRCRKCNTRNGGPFGGHDDSQRFIEPAPPCPYSIMLNQLRERAPSGSILSLDTQDMESDTWDVVVLTSTNRKINISFENNGAFATWNAALKASVDEQIARGFSADLKGEDGDRQLLITHAALAGGYGHCLFSTKEASEQFLNFVNGESVYSCHTEYNLGANFRCFLFSRFGELVEEVLIAARLRNTAGMSSNHYSNAYAAAVILHHEVDYFQRSLRNGHLRSLISTLFPASILTWLTCIGHELAQLIEEGCDSFHSWRSAIHGSMKKFRTQRRGETFSMSINLQRHIFSTVGVDDWFKLTPPLAPSFIYNEDWACLDLSGDAALERTLSYTSESYPSSSGEIASHSSTTSNPFMEIPPQVPFSSPAFGTDDFGQISYHFSGEADHELPLGTDASMTSMDPRYLVSNDWMTYQGPF